MSKKDKKRHPESGLQETSTAHPTISRMGWKVIGIGAGVVILGFIVLSFTDPRAQNWAGHLSPFLIIGGYTTIGIGIMTNDPKDN